MAKRGKEQSAPAGAGEGGEGAKVTARERQMAERARAEIERLIAQKKFRSAEEAQAYIHDLLAERGLVARRQPQTPLEQAQEVMRTAIEAGSPQERVRLARQALQISPDCADAYVLLAEETESLEEACPLYAQGVAAGERAIGEEAFKEDVGHFWDYPETRPYVRARSGLADCLWSQGQRDEANEIYWDLLRLNPKDNLATRYILMAHLLEIGDEAGLRKLFKRYPNDDSPDWLYGHTLFAFMTEGDGKTARRLLAKAKKSNPYVPAYLTGKKQIPAQLPESERPGSEEEGYAIAAVELPLWSGVLGALDWLRRADRE